MNKIERSLYLDEVNSLLRRGVSPRKISELLRDKYNFIICERTIRRHNRNKVIPSYDTSINPEIYRKLDRIGNYRLRKAIERAFKILDTHKPCTCVNPLEFKKRGRIYLCKICNGWIRWDYARSIINQKKREGRDRRRHERLGFVVRRKRRFY